MSRALLLLALAGCSAAPATDPGASGGAGGDPPRSPVDCLHDPACGLAMVSAHRGSCGSEEPENTLARFQACNDLGITIIEVDTRLSADGLVVINHDDDVLRTTDGATRFPGRTRVDQLTAAEFTDLTMRTERCAGPDADPLACHPATLAGLLALGGDSALMLDFKAGDVAAVAAEVAAAGAERRILFFDADLDRLRLFKAALPGAQVMPRVGSAEEGRAVLAAAGQDLGIRWVHGDQAYAGELAPDLAVAGARLYANAFDLDVLLISTREGYTPEERREFLEAEVWPQLHARVAAGVSCFGTESAPELLGELYPGGWGR